jgi:hypothetical protein
VVEHLPSKLKALSANPSISKKKKKEKKRKSIDELLCSHPQNITFGPFLIIKKTFFKKERTIIKSKM